MVEVASAYVTLMPSMKGFQAKMNAQLKGMGTAPGEQAGDEYGKSFANRAASSLGKWAKRGLVATGVTIGAAVGTAIAGGMNRMLNIEDAENKLSGLGHSSEEVSVIMDNALASVKGTVFGLGEAATMSATAVAAGVKPGEDLVRYLTLTGDAATIAGVGLDEMGSIFGKVQTNQRAYTQELNQLADRGIPIYQWLQDEYGVTAEELRNMVSAGEVDAETYFKVIEENIGGAALNAGDTTRGALANLRAAWGRLGAELLEHVFPYFKDGLMLATDWADSLTERVGPAVDMVAGYVGDFIQEFKDGEGVGGQFRDVLERIRDAAIEFGEFVRDELLPRLRDLGEWMLDHKGVVAGVVGAYLTLRGVMVAHTAAMAVMQAGGMLAWLGKWAAQLKIVRAAKAAWAAVTWLVQGAMKALNLVMRMNPIGLLVTAIMLAVGAFIYLWKTNEDFRNFFIDAWEKIKDTLVGIWDDYIMPVFRAIWSWITETLVPAFVSFYKDVIVPVWEGIWGAIKAAWDFIYPIFTEVAGFIMDILVVYFNVLATTVEVVWKTIWAIIKGSWENWILPVFTAIWSWIKDTLIPWFEMLWGKVRDVWDWISEKVSDAYAAYIEPIFSAIYDWIKDTLLPWFASLWEGVRDAFDWIGDKINSVWERWISPAFDAISSGVDYVKDAFESAVEGIGNAWDKVKTFVAKPIVAVIEFVNDGIIAGVNRILDWANVSTIDPIGIPTSLKNAAAGFSNLSAAQKTYGNSYGPGLGGYADGGVLPGYSPGYDNMRFMGPNGSLELSGGEAIMRPEWTKAVGTNFVNSMNAIAKNGGTKGVQQALGFSDGGIMPTGDGMGFVSGLWDFLKGPVNFLKEQFAGPLELLRGNPLFDFAGGVIKKSVDWIKDKILGLFGFNSDSEAAFTGEGMGWQNIWAIVKGMYPDAILTSAVRNSTVAGYGGRSLHADGRAIDFVLNPWSRMVEATMRLSQLAGWTELIHTPAGMWQQSFGRPFADFLPVTKAQHYNHVHVGMKDGGVFPTLYDQGGWLQPGVSLVANKTGKPEAVFTDEQLQRMGGDTNVTLYGIPMDTAGQTADEVLYQMRRVSRGKYAARRR